VAGLVKDLRPTDTISRTIQEITQFGVAVGSVSGQPDQGRPPISNTAVILDDGGTWTAGDLVSVVNGVTVTTTFATDKATSMAAHAAAIQALGFITSATYSSGDNTITIVAAANVHLSVTTSVAGITGNMTITSTTYGMTDDILGVARIDTIESGSYRAFGNDRGVATLSGDAITTSDTVDGSVNGVAIAQVTYATSEANTLQLVANAIKAIAGVSDAVVNSTLRTIDVTMNNGLPLDSLILTVDDDTVASVSPTFAVVYSEQGVAIPRNRAYFLPTELVPVLRKGVIWMQAEEALTPADSAFIRIQATASFAVRGRIRNDVDSGTCVAVTAFNIVGNTITDPNGQLIVPVEMNQP
jgi:hypothetical protein